MPLAASTVPAAMVGAPPASRKFPTALLTNSGGSDWSVPSPVTSVMAGAPGPVSAVVAKFE